MVLLTQDNAAVSGMRLQIVQLSAKMDSGAQDSSSGGEVLKDSKFIWVVICLDQGF